MKFYFDKHFYKVALHMWKIWHCASVSFWHFDSWAVSHDYGHDWVDVVGGCLLKWVVSISMKFSISLKNILSCIGDFTQNNSSKTFQPNSLNFLANLETWKLKDSRKSRLIGEFTNFTSLFLLEPINWELKTVLWNMEFEPL